MFGFFRRKPTPPAPPPPPRFEPRSTSLVPGDLVVCINDDWSGKYGYAVPGPHPVKDEVYRVTRVRMAHAPIRYGDFTFHPGPWLYVSLRPDVGYSPDHFRKAQLDHTPAEEEFTARIRDLIKEPV